MIGDLGVDGRRPLGEDELVGLFERTSMYRNRPLIRVLAHAVIAYEGAEARSQWARRLYKAVRFATGPRVLDVLTTDELAELIASATGDHDSTSLPASRVDMIWHERTAEASTAGGTSSAAAPEPSAMSGRATIDWAFHRDMVAIYERARTELGYDAAYLLRTCSSDGGVAAAQDLITSDQVSEGFRYLWEHKRLDLSVEALALKDKYAELFDAEILERARRRLSDFGYHVG